MFDLDLSIGIQLIAGLIFSGGAGYLAYKLMEKLGEGRKIAPDVKRYSAWALTVVLAWAAYGALLWFGVYDVPATAQELVLTLLSVAFVAFTSSQGFHAKNELRAR